MNSHCLVHSHILTPFSANQQGIKDNFDIVIEGGGISVSALFAILMYKFETNTDILNGLILDKYEFALGHCK